MKNVLLAKYEAVGSKLLLLICWEGARASRRHLVSVDKEAAVRIASIEAKHPVNDMLLKAFALVTRGQGSTSSFREQAGLDPFRLRIIGYVLNDDTPFAVGIFGTERAGVVDRNGKMNPSPPTQFPSSNCCPL